MSGVQLGAALRQIHGLFEAGTVAGLTDGQLLDRYLARRDESAFAALVTRHGPMVLGVCHSVLRGMPEVEDAFQATFLVLIRKAGSIRGRDTVGGWLHRVAHRVAVQAAQDRSRTARREQAAGDLTDLTATGEADDADWHIPLHEELARLPERLRQPIVLCYLEGKTHAQAAFELRWSEATLRRRLADARELLRGRLTRRGLAISAAALSLATAPEAMAAVPPAWVDGLARLAADPIAGSAAAAPAARLALGFIRSQLAGRARAVANVAALLLSVGLAAGHLIPAGPARADDPARPASRPAAAAPRPAPTAPKPAAEGMLAISGRVLDPDGKPFPRARIYAYRPDPRDGEALFAPGSPAPDATSDADGRYRFETPDPGFQTLQTQATWTHPTIVALAPGFGPAWASFTTKAEARDLTLKLARDDVPILGRVLDLEGRPVPGVNVRPVGVFASPGEDLSDWEAAMAGARDISEGAMARLPRMLELFRWGKDLAVKTDAEGRFRLAGIGRERVVSLWIEGPTIATAFADIHARTRPGPTHRLSVQRDRPDFGTLFYHGSTFDYTAAPTLPIEGTVRDRDTGEPVAGISIRSERFAGNIISGRDHVRTTSGPDGRYRLVGMPTGSGNRITANPGPARPYLGAGSDVPGGSGPAPATVDFALKHGVAIRGKVVNKTTGKPVPAGVEYLALLDNPHRSEVSQLHRGQVRTQPDGSFEIVGLPGRGLVTVRGERDDYLVGQGADQAGKADQNGWIPADPHPCQPEFIHAVVAIEPAEDARSFRCDLAVDPGIERQGTVVGPDGQPVSGCRALNLRPGTMSPNIVRLASPAFTAGALDPKHARPLFFRHDEKKLVAVVMVSGDQAGPLTVRLQSSAAVTGRLLDDDGQPRHGVSINERFTQGRLGPGYHFPMLKPSLGDDGTFRIEGLIPGVAYNLGARLGITFFGDFATGLTLRPGETRDLGIVNCKQIR